MGQFIRHGACEKCGSSNARGFYEAGDSWCFSCEKWEPPPDGAEVSEESEDDVKERRQLVSSSFQDIQPRGLREDICRKYGYGIGTFKGKKVHVANYRLKPGTAPVAQKLRGKDKEFTITGKPKEMGLFGQHLWNSGKSIVITEGEIDALSFAMAFQGKYPAVSLPNGAQSAAKAIKNAYDYLMNFETILLAFDMDEHGAKAVEEVAPLLPPGRVKVISLPRKDANEVLMNEGPAALVKAYWDAPVWRPDGIISGAEITLEDLMEACAQGYSIPYPKLNEMLQGLRKRELLLLTAGSGIGKSTLARELAYHLHQAHGLIIGNIYLEESHKKTAQGYIAIDNNVPLGKLRANPKLLTLEQWEASRQKVVVERMQFYNHFGSLTSARLLQKMRYMVQVLGVDFIILDHISIVVSGQESSSEGERRDIDMLMTALRSLIEETGVGVIAIVHLKQPEGKPHEEGGRVTLSHLRGSGSLKQLSDAVAALERDQQGEANDISLIRLLKNREHGDVGEADHLQYARDTGRMVVTEAPPEGFGDMDDEPPF